MLILLLFTYIYTAVTFLLLSIKYSGCVNIFRQKYSFVDHNVVESLNKFRFCIFYTYHPKLHLLLLGDIRSP